MTAKKRFIYTLLILLLLISVYTTLGSYFQLSGQYELALVWVPWQPDRFEWAGVSAAKAGQAARAIELLRQARDTGRLSAEGRQLLGELLWQAGEQKNALLEWDILLQADAPSQALFERLSDAYLVWGRLDEESRLVIRGLALYPDSVKLTLRRARWLMTENPPQALPLLESLQSVDRRDAGSLLSALKQALSEEDPAYQLTVCGRELASDGEWYLAERAFSRAIALDPTYAEAWGWLGQARQANGTPGALEALQQAVALNPQSASLYGQLGVYWQQQNRWAQAQSAFESAARLEPENPVWRAALGDVLAWGGDIPAAYAHYEAATQLAPHDASAWRNLALFCARHGSYLEESGLPAALKARALDKEDWRNSEALGRVLMALGQNESARRMLLEAIQQSPAQASPFYYLGLLYLRMERRPMAEQSLRLSLLLAQPKGTYADLAQRVLTRYFSGQ